MAAIVIPPSDDVNALRAAIGRAVAEGVPLRLLPGAHLTRPGRGPAHRIEIGAGGLDLAAEAPAGDAAVIRRPDRSIDLARPDDNYGLYFVPARASDEELAAARWRTHTDGTFEYTIVIRGRVSLAGVTLDCNMGRQGLEALDVRAAEHSAMLAFAGVRYTLPGPPGALPRVVYAGFESVTLRDLATVNGGYADDIWFSRGYFNPNIARVDICRLTGTDRVNERRATVSFSGVCQDVRIHDADIYKLEMEDTTATTYEERPRPADAFTPSAWDLADLAADRIDLAAKGKVYRLDAARLTTRRSLHLYQAGGEIRYSTLRAGPERRLFRLDEFTFRDVTWILDPDDAGVVHGLRPTAQYGDPCAVAFTGNTFRVPGEPAGGEILTGEYSRTVPDNRVTVSAVGCHYPPGFGAGGPRAIARVRERGEWTFARADLGGLDPAVALPKGPQADVVLTLI